MYDNIIIGQSTRGVRGMNKRIISFVLVICMISTCLTNVFYKEMAYAENVIQETEQGENSEGKRGSIGAVVRMSTGAGIDVEPIVKVSIGTGFSVGCSRLEDALSMVETCDSATIDLLADVMLEAPVHINMHDSDASLTIRLNQHTLEGNSDEVDIDFECGSLHILDGKIEGNIQIEKQGAVIGENVTVCSQESHVPAIGVYGTYQMCGSTVVQGNQGIHIFSGGSAQLKEGEIWGEQKDLSSEGMSYEVLVDDGCLEDILPENKALYVNGACSWVDARMSRLNAMEIGDADYAGVQITNAPIYLRKELEGQTADYGVTISLYLTYLLYMGDWSDVSAECYEFDSQGRKQVIEIEESAGEGQIIVQLRKMTAGEHKVYVRLLWQGGVYQSNVKTVNISVRKKRLSVSDFELASDNVYEKEYDGNCTCQTVRAVIKEGVVWNSTPVPVSGTATYDWSAPEKEGNRIVCVIQNLNNENYYIDSECALVKRGTIKKREVTLSLKGDVRKCYDGTATLTNIIRNSLYLEVGNLVEGDEVQAKATFYEFEDAAVGYSKKVYARRCYLTGLDSEHYSLTKYDVDSYVGTIYTGVTVSATPKPTATPIVATPVITVSPTKAPVVTTTPTKSPVPVTPVVTVEPTRTPMVVTPFVTVEPTGTPISVTPEVTVPVETTWPTVSPIAVNTPTVETDPVANTAFPKTTTPIAASMEPFVPNSQTENPSYDEEGESPPLIQTQRPVVTREPEEDEIEEFEDEVLIVQSRKSNAVGTNGSGMDDDWIYEDVDMDAGKDSEDVIELGGLPKKGWIIKSKSGCSYKITKVGENVTFVKPKGKNMVAYTIPNTVMIDDVQYDVTGIQKNALKNSKRLQVLTIGKNVKEIGSGAFANCTKLKTVIINAKKIKNGKVSKGTFSGIGPRTTVYVPKGKYKTYKKLFTSLGCKGQVKKE